MKSYFWTEYNYHFFTLDNVNENSRIKPRSILCKKRENQFRDSQHECCTHEVEALWNTHVVFATLLIKKNYRLENIFQTYGWPRLAQSAELGRPYAGKIFSNLDYMCYVNNAILEHPWRQQRCYKKLEYVVQK